MLITKLVTTGLAVAAFSAAALAAPAVNVIAQPVNPVPAETTQQILDRCAALELQFDRAVRIHAKSTEATTARQRRAEGDTACRTSQPGSGVTLLRQALKDLRQDPDA
jgi:hypothetical protein